MGMLEVTPTRQVALFVEKRGQRYLAEWIETELAGRPHTELLVFRHERLLVPRGVAVGIRDSQRDLSLAQAEHWLATQGYRVIARLEP
jgi:hypothetical protein